MTSQALNTAKHIMDTIYDRLAHGDEQHRAWLRGELDLIFAPLQRALAAEVPDEISP